MKTPNMKDDQTLMTRREVLLGGVLGSGALAWPLADALALPTPQSTLKPERRLWRPVDPLAWQGLRGQRSGDQQAQDEALWAQWHALHWG